MAPTSKEPSKTQESKKPRKKKNDLSQVDPATVEKTSKKGKPASKGPKETEDSTVSMSGEGSLAQTTATTFASSVQGFTISDDCLLENGLKLSTWVEIAEITPQPEGIPSYKTLIAKVKERLPGSGVHADTGLLWHNNQDQSYLLVTSSIVLQSAINRSNRDNIWDMKLIVRQTSKVSMRRNKQPSTTAELKTIVLSGEDSDSSLGLCVPSAKKIKIGQALSNNFAEVRPDFVLGESTISSRISPELPYTRGYHSPTFGVDSISTTTQNNGLRQWDQPKPSLTQPASGHYVGLSDTMLHYDPKRATFSRARGLSIPATIAESNF